MEESSKTKVESPPETVVPAPETTTEKVVETTVAQSTEAPATTTQVAYQGPIAESKPQPAVVPLEIPLTTETPTTEAPKTHHHQAHVVNHAPIYVNNPAPVQHEVVAAPVSVAHPSTENPITVEAETPAPVFHHAPIYFSRILHLFNQKSNRRRSIIMQFRQF